MNEGEKLFLAKTFANPVSELPIDVAILLSFA